MGVMVMSKEQQEQAPSERWSARAKTEAILRLFRGESGHGEPGDAGTGA